METARHCFIPTAQEVPSRCRDRSSEDSETWAPHPHPSMGLNAAHSMAAMKPGIPVETARGRSGRSEPLSQIWHCSDSDQAPLIKLRAALSAAP